MILKLDRGQWPCHRQLIRLFLKPPAKKIHPNTHSELSPQEKAKPQELEPLSLQEMMTFHKWKVVNKLQCIEEYNPQSLQIIIL